MSTVRSSITFDRSRLCGHNSLSSSILGYEAILGEGSMITDTRLDGLNVSVNMPNQKHVSGRSHLGAIICDGAHVGASSVINPGTVIDSNAHIYPLSSVSGYIPPYSRNK
jgi:acetyltransferase-like isoleucine patch superfamily enzyme